MFDRFRSNERAIEGLPVRLVIALVVGVASLSVMMNTLSGLNTMGVSELDAKPTPEVVNPGDKTITVRVVDASDEPVANATIVAKGGTATLDTVKTATTNAKGQAKLQIHPTLGPNQDEGTVTLDIKPPASGQFVDKRENTKILVVSN